MIAVAFLSDRDSRSFPDTPLLKAAMCAAVLQKLDSNLRSQTTVECPTQAIALVRIVSKTVINPKF